MRRMAIACGLVCAAAGLGRAQIKLTDSATVVFATAEEGKKILTARDDFIRALSPFDRAVRMKTDRDISEEMFLEFVGCSVLDWTDAEKAAFTAAVDRLRERLVRLALPWPKVIHAIKTRSPPSSSRSAAIRRTSSTPKRLWPTISCPS